MHGLFPRDKNVGLWYFFLFSSVSAMFAGRRLNLWSTVICHATQCELLSQDKVKRTWNHYSSFLEIFKMLNSYRPTVFGRVLTPTSPFVDILDSDWFWAT